MPISVRADCLLPIWFWVHFRWERTVQFITVCMLACVCREMGARTGMIPPCIVQGGDFSGFQVIEYIVDLWGNAWACIFIEKLKYVGNEPQPEGWAFQLIFTVSLGKA